jgi:hypothetical protein
MNKNATDAANSEILKSVKSVESVAFFFNGKPETRNVLSE